MNNFELDQEYVGNTEATREDFNIEVRDEKRFAGYNKEEKSLNADTHQKYILGGHVADYLNMLSDDALEKYQSQFSSFVEAGVERKELEKIYLDAHAAIRADPFVKLTDKKALSEMQGQVTVL